MADSQRKTANLFDGVIEQGTIRNDGTESAASNRIRTAGYTSLTAGTYTLSFTTTETAVVFVFLYDSNNTFVTRIPTDWTTQPYTFTLDESYKIRFVIKYPTEATITPSDISDVVISGWAHSLQKFDGAAWQNATVNEKSENLLDVPYFIANMETNPLNANNKVLEYTLKPNTYYTLTSNFYLNYNACWFICLPDTVPSSGVNGIYADVLVRTVQTGSDGKLWIWGRTVATPEGAKPVAEMGDSDWVMLNEGQTALPYEPYWE